MRNLHNDHHYLIIVDLVQDTVFPLAYPILVIAGQFFAATGTRVFTQTLDAVNDPSPVPIREALDLLHRRWFDEKFIVDDLAKSHQRAPAGAPKSMTGIISR
jgi:hypothetical protein